MKKEMKVLKYLLITSFVLVLGSLPNPAVSISVPAKGFESSLGLDTPKEPQKDCLSKMVVREITKKREANNLDRNEEQGLPTEVFNKRYLDFTFWNLILVLGGFAASITLVLLTLRAVQAATLQATISADTAQKQLRAYLLLVNCDAYVKLFPSEINLKIRYKNHGTSPAHNVILEITASVENYGYQDKLLDQHGISGTFMKFQGGIVGHDAMMLTSYTLCGLPLEHLEGLANKTKQLVIAGRLAYTDIFGNKQITEYQFVNMEPLTEGNIQSLSYSECGNCAT